MEKTNIFIAYSREDEAYLKHLRKYLAPLERETIETWYDGKIEAGEVWDEKIKTHLHAADIILLLVSANSLASDYFYNKEMKDALVRHERKEAIVVPVILKYCGWDITELGALQALPKDAKPISAWSDESAAYDSVLRGIYQNVQTIQERKKKAAPTYTEPPRPQSTTPTEKTKITTKTKPVSQNNDNNNFGKILKIALPVLIGIAAIFGIFNWINNRPVSDNTPKDKSSISNNKTNIKSNDSEKTSISEEPENHPPNSLPKPIQDLIKDMVRVQGGDFTMGQPEPDIGGNTKTKDEQPPHPVTLSSFSISKREVTNQQFCAFLNKKSNKEEGGAKWLRIGDRSCKIERQRGGSYIPKNGYAQHPVVEVSWFGAKAFCDWVGQVAGKNFRLPTEAEWEYAARGRHSDDYKYAGSDDIESVAWYSSNSNNSTQTVGTKSSNELGLYDMSGNVWEWCNDWYDKNYYAKSSDTDPQGPDSTQTHRVIRGGSWETVYHGCRVADRAKEFPSNGKGGIGFRLARTP